MALVLDWRLVLVILEVAVGLGMVIFVHELGHFAVAKLCGVKVEKFYLGFDIYGLKLARFRRGETEYGIGILPLGGYVKMLGQDDNPAKAAEERRRSLVRAGSPSSEGGPGAVVLPGPVPASEEHETLDPRSYMAKSVPQRMAIISAGVVMNVIFAFLMAIVAYLMGVKEVACGVSAVEPGEAAWRADLHPGDQFVGIDDWSKRQLRFRDLRYAVALANLETGVNFEIKRVGVEKPFWITIKPDMKQGRLLPTIGVRMPMTTTLQEQYAVMPDSPAAAAGEFRPGDKIVAVGGQPVDSYADLDSQMARHPDEPLVFTVERRRTGRVRPTRPPRPSASTSKSSRGRCARWAW